MLKRIITKIGKIAGFVTISLFFFVPTIWSQTISDLQTQYGEPVMSYPVSENIWMSPEFTEDGQLCVVRLYPKKIDARTNYLGYTLSLQEVKDVFDKLIPVSVRGNQKEDYGMLISGNMVFAGFGYENARINFVSSFSSFSDKRIPEERVVEFPHIQSPQIVTISWLNRKCSSQSTKGIW